MTFILHRVRSSLTSCVLDTVTADNNIFFALYIFLMEDFSQKSYSSAKTRPRGGCYANIRIDRIHRSWKGSISLQICLFFPPLAYAMYFEAYCVHIRFKFQVWRYNFLPCLCGFVYSAFLPLGWSNDIWAGCFSHCSCWWNRTICCSGELMTLMNYFFFNAMAGALAFN